MFGSLLTIEKDLQAYQEKGEVTVKIFSVNGFYPPFVLKYLVGLIAGSSE